MIKSLTYVLIISRSNTSILCYFLVCWSYNIDIYLHTSVPQDFFPTTAAVLFLSCLVGQLIEWNLFPSKQSFKYWHCSLWSDIVLMASPIRFHAESKFPTCVLTCGKFYAQNVYHKRTNVMRATAVWRVVEYIRQILLTERCLLSAVQCIQWTSTQFIDSLRIVNQVIVFLTSVYLSFHDFSVVYWLYW